MNNGWLDIFLLNVTVLGEGALYGVDINTGGIADSFANFVWEPSVVKVFFCGLSMQSFLHIFAVSPLSFFWGGILSGYTDFKLFLYRSMP